MYPLHEQAYQKLKEMITTGKLSHQEIYSETQIAQKFGISRTPLRDAIHRLKQEGLIDILPSRGFSLHKLTQKDVIETFQVRSALECYCTLEITKQYAASRALTLFEKLDDLLTAMKQIINTSHSIEDFCSYDFQFHTAIIDYVQNEQFSQIFQTFLYRMEELAKLSLARKGRMEATFSEHQNIFLGMKNGDAAHIYEITLLHMENPKDINLSELEGFRHDE